MARRRPEVDAEDETSADDDSFDWRALGVPHGGEWTRPTPDDDLGVRCDAHGLLPEEHDGFGE